MVESWPGITAADAAAELGCSEGTVRDLLRRAASGCAEEGGRLRPRTAEEARPPRRSAGMARLGDLLRSLRDPSVRDVLAAYGVRDVPALADHLSAVVRPGGE